MLCSLVCELLINVNNRPTRRDCTQFYYIPANSVPAPLQQTVADILDFKLSPCFDCSFLPPSNPTTAPLYSFSLPHTFMHPPTYPAPASFPLVRPLFALLPDPVYIQPTTFPPLVFYHCLRRWNR